MMSTLATSLEPWAEFGIAGLVVGASFVLLWKVIQLAYESFTNQAGSHKEERDQWQQAIREQGATLEQQGQRVDAALRELTMAIKDTWKK